MRAVLSLIAAAGCYGPKVPAGAPCDPAAPACPVGQMCLPSGVCAIGGPPSDAAADAPVDVAIDAPADAAPSFAYPASIAKCINPMAVPPDPAACATAAGTHAIRIDSADGSPAHPWDAFLRFDLDNQIDVSTVIAVSLELTVTNGTQSHSTNSGTVYKSTAFTAADLSLAEPAKAQAGALAPSQGAVANLQTVSWPLPTTIVMPGGSVYLELENTSADGVLYFDDLGMSPPMLRIYHR